MPLLIIPVVAVLTYAGCTLVDVCKEAYDRNRARREQSRIRIVREG